MSDDTTNLLVTGRPGIGKTTSLIRLCTLLEDRGYDLRGFVTEEILQGDQRVGFRMKTLEGDSDILAYQGAEGPKVSKYGVDVEAIDAMVERTLRLEDGADIYVVDEIGKMESKSERFVAAMRRLLDSDRPVIATIGEGGTGFMAETRDREDVELWELDADNRDHFPGRATEWLEQRMS